MAISMIGLIVLVVVAILVVKVILFFATGIGGRKGSPGDTGNQSHPRLNQCPGCGASLDAGADLCPHCGLRIAN